MKLIPPVRLYGIALSLLAACLAPASAATESPADVTSSATELPPDSQPVKLEFLRVHPENDSLIHRGIAKVPGYRLAHQTLYDEKTGSPRLDRNGKPLTEDYWIETEESASSQGFYLCEKDLAEAEIAPALPNCIYLVFGEEGSRTMHRLTSSMHIGRDRLGIVVNGEIRMAPIVQGTLSHEVMINAFRIPGEREALVRSLQAAIRQQQEAGR